jgi:hypothetical protein
MALTTLVLVPLGVAHAVPASTPRLATSGRLVDDTGTIAVSVPDSWNDTRTAPIGTHPHISASPDLSEFDDEFESGIAFEASVDQADAEAILGALGDSQDCDEDYVPVSFDNGVFAGEGKWWSECGDDRRAELVVVPVKAIDQSLTAVVRLQAATSTDIDDVESALCSIGLVSGSDTNAAPTTRSDHGSTPVSADEALSADNPDDTIGPDEIEVHCDDHG